MIKKMKLSTLISLSLGLISFLCMTVLVIFISTRVSGVVREQAVGNMTTALEGQANLIEQFVADSELALKEYATASDIKKLLSDPETPEYIESA